MHYEKFADGGVKCIEDEIPFDLPEGWKWVRLGFLGQYKKGPFGSSITKAMFIPDSPSAIKIYEQKNAINKDVSLGSYFISLEKYESLKSFEVFPGDIIVSCAGTIGETYVLPDGIRRGIINQALMKISLYDLSILDFYLMYFDFRLKSDAKEQGHGIALKNIPPFDVLKKYLFPVPPEQEQRRIIIAVTKLLSEIDAIESNKEQIAEYISKAKAKILDLAIRGKLVPQDPSDKPASVLLEHIRAKKEELIKQGKIKRDKKESIIFRGDDNSYYLSTGSHDEPIEERMLFELPEGWAWCCLCNIAQIELGKTLDQNKNTGTLYPYLRSVNVKWNELYLSDLNTMRFEEEELERYTVKKGDLLICEGGDVGRCCIWNRSDTILYQNALHRVRFYGNCLPEYFLYSMMYFESIGLLKEVSKGVTIKHLTQATLNSIPFPLPPLEEQKKIVFIIEEYFEHLNNIQGIIA